MPITTKELMKRIDWELAQRMINARRTNASELARLLRVSSTAVLRRVTHVSALESTRRRPRCKSPHRPEPTTRARVRFEEAYGVVLDKDTLVHHLDGDSTNDRIENLMAVTRSEHAFIHSAAFFAALGIVLKERDEGPLCSRWFGLRDFVIDVLLVHEEMEKETETGKEEEDCQ